MSSSPGSYVSEDVTDLVIKSLFAKYDQDGNGTLDRAEQMIMLKEDFGMKPEQASNYILQLDKQEKGYLTQDEFVECMNRLIDDERLKNSDKTSRYCKLVKAVEDFRKYDSDQSGELDENEFRQMMAGLNYQVVNVDEVFQTLDVNGDGGVSFPEFLAWLRWL